MARGKQPDESGVAVRDAAGRFQPGTRMGGRPKGSRHAISEDFLREFHQVWKRKGAAAIESLPEDKLVEAAIKILPKEMHLEAGEGLSDMIRRAAEVLASRGK